jgi:16S rRNA (guanine527-N7)-methyltransferase
VVSVSKRLAELAERYSLAPVAVAQLEELLAIVAADDTAPTTVREPKAGVDAHVADSLAGLEVEGLRSAVRIADLGAGAGFPGLVLAAARPEADVALLESVGRKCAFLDRAAAAIGLDNAEVVCSRVEEWRDGLSVCDAVTVRAVAPLNVVAEYAAPLLRVGGVLVAWKGLRDPEEEAGGAAAAQILGLEATEIRPVAPFRGADHRHLHVFTKVHETPERFPRRAGMARKRPLSARG